MLFSNAKEIVVKLLKMADVEINGSRPWDIQVYDERFYEEVLRYKQLGFGDSYIARWWDCAALDVCVYRIVQADLESKIRGRLFFIYSLLTARLLNLQNKQRALEVIKQHYDIRDDVFRCTLDKNMLYTCGYWSTAKNLDQAQLDKLDLSFKKLELKPGMRLLDIGCGWGGLAKHAAENYGVQVVGITISKEQARVAQERCKGLPVEIRVQDYRDQKDKFDRVIAMGMFEHVGYKNYRRFMKVVKSCLVENGLFLLHTIGSNVTYVHDSFSWMNKHIFPNGMMPSIKQLGASFEKIFIMEDWHNFGAYYDPTLMAWYHNFNQNWDELKSKYDEQFRRMWNFYLLSCAGTARARGLQLWQIILSNVGVEGGYQSIRI